MVAEKNKYIVRFLKFFGLVGIIILVAQTYQGSSSHVDYNKDVKPILNKHCISCHGGVKQSNGFSLLSRSRALEPTESGHPAIIPGNIKESEFIRRLTTDDLDERMPFEKSALSKSEIKTLKKWIKQGAEWGLHWAYQPITAERFEQDETVLMGWISKKKQTPSIDFYVDRALQKIGLKRNPVAKRAELLRRVSFDLIGLPPSAGLIDDFVLNQKISYEAVVEELLENPAFGEKWTSMWLDIARYADSKGYERDPNRSIWRYRDYVIRSFNSDKPYDQFLIEQLAGDLLNDPTEEQLVATGFHRNTTTNDEGGTDNEEFRVKAVMDRVNTTWEGLMGTTMACVQCHGHPYDPFPHEEYYQSFAFHNNTRDADTHADYPRLNFLDSIDQGKLKALKKWIVKVDSEDKGNQIEELVRTVQPVIYSIETDQLDNAALYDTKYLGIRKNGSARIPNLSLAGKTHLWMRTSIGLNGGKLTLRLDQADGPVIGSLTLSKSKRGYEIKEVSLKPTEGTHDVYIHYSNPQLQSHDRPGIMFDWFYFTESFPGHGLSGYSSSKKDLFELLAKWYDHTLIMTENPSERQRKTHVFDRGNWLIHKEEVSPKVPSILHQIDNGGDPSRLAFAKWIADKTNPLTARTFVNRVWEQIFGQGLVLTTEDFGSQGIQPTHPELLDWLSYTWMHDQEWSVKSLIKKIVLSDTYQQSAKISDKALLKDPGNQFLSRSPRVRLNAEQVRDQALMISGIMSPKMYGPPVMPFQPENIWEIPYSNEKWTMSTGEDRYRRGIYTMIKRSGLYPSMETFDMAPRQVCVSRRIRTNTPLQALVTLNDPVFVEASEALAERMRSEGGENIEDQISFAYQLGMGEKISKEKSQILQELYKNSMKSISGNRNNAEQEKFALTTVANAIINLDEFLNK